MLIPYSISSVNCDRSQHNIYNTIFDRLTQRSWASWRSETRCISL